MDAFHRNCKGRTLLVEGVLFWEPEDRKRKPVKAVYHHDIRQELLNRAGDLSRYTYRRKEGSAPTDKTAYHGRQGSWGADPTAWPDILFQFEPDTTRRNVDPPEWYHEGKLVINVEKRPMRLIDELPSVISSKYEGAFIVAVLRQNKAITYDDLLSRMPSKSTQNDEEMSFAKCSDESQRSEFRNKHGLLSWDRGNPKRDSYLRGLLTDAQRTNNTIRGRADFTIVQEARLRSLCIRVRPNRARKAVGAESNDQRAIKRQKKDLRNLRAGSSDGVSIGPSTVTTNKSGSGSLGSNSVSEEDVSSDESSKQASQEGDDEGEREDVGDEDSSEGGSHEDDHVMDESGPDDNFELLDKLPNTNDEVQYISAAINPTICDLHKVLSYRGQMTEIPSPDLTYRSQYTYLQGRLEELWIYRRIPGPCPVLPYRKPSLETQCLGELQYAELVQPWDHEK
ncbi:MAG: hypothetical protein Q9215_004670 [Flavoplaca cf. flavocitrina]